MILYILSGKLLKHVLLDLLESTRQSIQICRMDLKIGLVGELVMSSLDDLACINKTGAVLNSIAGVGYEKIVGFLDIR